MTKQELIKENEYLKKRLTDCHKTLRRYEWYQNKYMEGIDNMANISRTTYCEIDKLVALMDMESDMRNKEGQ